MLTEEQKQELQSIALQIMQPGKGILAADDTNDGMGSKLKTFNLENTPENRRKYRELVFTTPNFEKYVSAVILFDDTYHQETSNGQRFVDLLREKNLVVGIQADLGLVPLEGGLNEVSTQGLDDLAKRAAAYKKGGCSFAKWRCSYRISDTTPSQLALVENANVLARYASICQAQGLVPFVEPDVSCEGDHSLERCKEVTEQVLAHTYTALNNHKVYLEGTILKTNMVVSGLSANHKATPEQVGQATLSALQRTVPAAVPGVGFLSGGLSELASSQYLNAVNQAASQPGKNGLSGKPWRLTFCYGRALLNSCTESWNGQEGNVEKAQSAFLKRAKANADAEQGQYNEE